MVCFAPLAELFFLVTLTLDGRLVVTFCIHSNYFRLDAIKLRIQYSSQTKFLNMYTYTCVVKSKFLQLLELRSKIW
jgi:hypothetical protein